MNPKYQLIQLLWTSDLAVIARASECEGLPEGGDPYPKICLGSGVHLLSVTREGFSGPFLDQGQKLQLLVPWSAILAIEASGTFVAFPPCRVQIGIPVQEGPPAEDEATRKIPVAKKGHLRGIPGGKK